MAQGRLDLARLLRCIGLRPRLVSHDDTDEALGGQALAERSILLPIAKRPDAAVHKEEDWRWRRADRRFEDVQAAARSQSDCRAGHNTQPVRLHERQHRDSKVHDGVSRPLDVVAHKVLDTRGQVAQHEAIEVLLDVAQEAVQCQRQYDTLRGGPIFELRSQRVPELARGH